MWSNVLGVVRWTVAVLTYLRNGTVNGPDKFNTSYILKLQAAKTNFYLYHNYTVIHLIAPWYKGYYKIAQDR